MGEVERGALRVGYDRYEAGRCPFDIAHSSDNECV